MIIPETLGAMALNSTQAGSMKLSLPRWVSDQGWMDTVTRQKQRQGDKFHCRNTPGYEAPCSLCQRVRDFIEKLELSELFLPSCVNDTMLGFSGIMESTQC